MEQHPHAYLFLKGDGTSERRYMTPTESRQHARSIAISDKRTVLVYRLVGRLEVQFEYHPVRQ